MGYKIRDWGGSRDADPCTVLEYVEQQLGETGGHGYGELEQLQAELEATQELLLKLVGIVSRSMTPQDIHELTGAEWEPRASYVAQIVEVKDNA